MNESTSTTGRGDTSWGGGSKPPARTKAGAR